MLDRVHRGVDPFERVGSEMDVESEQRSHPKSWRLEREWDVVRDASHRLVSSGVPSS